MKSLSKLIAALAVSLPLAAAAQPAAPKAEVTLYGTLNVNLQYTKAGGATTAAQSVKERYAVSTDSSNIGVRATADLVEQLKATAQCETSAAVDGIGVSGICNRNSRVGLTSPWGTLWYGNWDTPFKAAAYGTKVDDPFLNTDVYGFNTIMGSPGFNYRSSGWKTATADAITGFDVRASNSVGYWTPKVHGISAKLQHSVNEFANVTNSPLSPKLWGAVINYDDHGLSVLAAYENHDDGLALRNVNPATVGGRAFGAAADNINTAASTDTAWRVGAGYELKTEAGATTVGAMVDELTLQQKGAPTGAVAEYKRLAWQVTLKHRYGNHELRARYSTADKGSCKLVGGAACSTTGYGATDLAVGYAYHLASSTQVYLHYAQVTNSAQATYTFSIGGAPAVAGSTPRGADPQALGLGIRYSF